MVLKKLAESIKPAMILPCTVKNVVLCFDRDEPGLRFAETVTKRLAERGCNVEKRLPAVGKDYNESLIWYKSKIEKQRGERV